MGLGSLHGSFSPTITPQNTLPPTCGVAPALYPLTKCACYRFGQASKLGRLSKGNANGDCWVWACSR